MRVALLTILPILITILVVELVMPLIIPRLQKRAEQDEIKAKERREVRPEKVFAVFLKIAVIFITVVFIAFIIASLFPQVREELGDDFIIIFVIFAVAFVAICFIAWVILRRVTYDDEYFEYINALGFGRKFTYGDIEKIKYISGIVRVCTKKKSFIIFKSYAGCGDFIAFIKRKNPHVTIT